MNLIGKIDKKVFIVAEIGNNHDQDLDVAKKLVDAAVSAGADAVKFQTCARGTDIIIPTVLSSEYPDWDVTKYKYWHMFVDSIVFPLEMHKEIFDYAGKKGIIPFSTPTSLDVVDFLEKLNVSIFKIASMDVTNVQLLEKIAYTGKPVIMSTGMADEKEIEKAISFLDPKKLILLHCVSDYPLDYSNANLKSMSYLHKRFGCPVGFSDHSLGYDLAVAAVASGACVVEKHITLNRDTDKKAEHHISLEPSELKVFVAKVRQIEAAMGKEEIRIAPDEETLRMKARRSLHINKSFRKGHVLQKDDICVLRPADGALPEEMALFIGKHLKRGKDAWEPLTREDL